MSCSNFFDWMNQSSQHMNLSYGNWPLIAELASVASSLGDFEQLIRELDPAEAVMADNQIADWWSSYGFEWGQNQCSQESSPGESGATGTSTWTPGKPKAGSDDVKSIQRALRAAGYDPGKLDGKWGPKSCKAAYLFKIERLKDYGEKLDWNFFANLGFPGQDGQDYTQQYGTICKPYHSQLVKPRESDVEAVQLALVRKGYLSNSQVSGRWTEVTCKAIFKFQRAVFGDAKKGLMDRETFVALGFGPATAGTYESLYATKCQGYWGGDEDSKPKPVTPGKDDTPVSPVAPSKPKPNLAGMSWVLGILAVGAAIGGTVYFTRKK